MIPPKNHVSEAGMKEIEADEERLKPNRGAIALGHPLDWKQPTGQGHLTSPVAAVPASAATLPGPAATR
ncbi:hypothetical protein [Rhodococcus erythropolis]|uniref:hypothetical protein n=1 Tax=Rhodococcus erythropolis TaxID=1833 RepID=UPI0037FB79EB